MLLQSIVVYFAWDASFVVCSTAFFIAGIAALGLGTSIPIVSLDESRNEA